jgi:hypothetical protein
MSPAEEIIRLVIASHNNVFFVRYCIPEMSAFQNGRAANDVNADLYGMARNILLHNVHDVHGILDSVVVVDGTVRFQCQICADLARALRPSHPVPSVIGVRNNFCWWGRKRGASVASAQIK